MQIVIAFISKVTNFILGNWLIVFVCFLAITFLLSLPPGLITVDEANYYDNAKLLIQQGDLTKPCSGDAGEFPAPNKPGECLYKYNLGTSLFLLPAAALDEVMLVPIITFAAFAAGGGVFFLLLKSYNLPAAASLLYFTYPALLFHARTGLSEIYSVVLLLTLALIAKKLSGMLDRLSGWWFVAAGLVASMAVLVRYTNALPAGIILIGLLLYTYNSSINFRLKIQSALNIILGGLPITVLILWLNNYLYGGPLTSGYSLSGEQLLSTSQFAPQLLGYLIVLNLLWPGMLIVAFTRIRRYALLLIPAFVTIIFYLFSPNSLFDGDWTDLVTGIRFVEPIVPFLLIAYADFLHKLSQRFFSANLKNSRLTWIILIALISIFTVALQFIHLIFVQSRL